MNLKKSLLVLSAVATMGMGSAFAMNIGFVNVNAVIAAYPGVQSYEQKEKAVVAQYQPQLQKIQEQMQATKEEAAARKIYDESYVPLAKKATAAVDAIWSAPITKVNQSIDKVRAEKKISVVLSNPAAVIAAEEGTQAVDITQDVINLVKK